MGRRVVRSSSQDMKRLLLAPAGGKFLRPLDGFDQVYPGILLGDACTALSIHLLQDLKVTHVLNAAYGKNDYYCGGYVNTGESYYERAGIQFLGIPASDTPSFYLRSYFREAADFIADALRTRGKILVHCQCGISRSATLIAAYLMLKKKMDVTQALQTIRTNRSVFPNQGFLSQLCDLDYEMKRKGELVDSGITSFEEGVPIKDSLKCSTHSDKFPNFSTTNYFPVRMPITKSGYPITSAFDNYEIETRSRARSTDRYDRRSSYDRNCRSVSPAPVTYRTIRSSSVIPQALMYQDDREYSPAPRTSSHKEYERASSCTPFMASYEMTPRPYQSTYSYYTRTSPEPFYYTPKKYTRPITETYLRSRTLPSYTEPSLVRTLTPRDTTFYSARPYESYTYTSPYISRNFSTYVPADSSYYVVRRPRIYTSSSTDPLLYSSSYVPSVLRYPALVDRSYYTRYY